MNRFLFLLILLGITILFSACKPDANAPIADFSSNKKTVEPGESIMFSDHSKNSPETWEWSFPGGEPSTSELQNPIVSYSEPENYSVYLKVTGEGGSDVMVKEDYIEVVAEVMGADFSANKTTIIPGEVIFFTDHSNNSPEAWEWSFPGGEPSTSALENPEVIYSKIGVYSVSLVVTGEGGTDTITKTDYIEVVAETLVADFSISEDRIKTGGTVTLTDRSSGNPTNWKWFVSGPLFFYTFITQDVTLTLDNFGLYTVILMVNNEEESDEFEKTDCIEVFANGLTLINTTPGALKVSYENTYEYINAGNTFKLFDQNGDGEIIYNVETAEGTGLKLFWDEGKYYTQSGDESISLEVNADFFFLIIDSGTSDFDKEIINPGLIFEITEYVSITPAMDPVSMGYYDKDYDTEIQCYLVDEGNEYLYWNNIAWSELFITNTVLSLSTSSKKSGDLGYTITKTSTQTADRVIISR